MLGARVLERKFSELSSQSAATQGIRHAGVRDRHEVILKGVIKHAPLCIDE